MQIIAARVGITVENGSSSKMESTFEIGIWNTYSFGGERKQPTNRISLIIGPYDVKRRVSIIGQRR